MDKQADVYTLTGIYQQRNIKMETIIRDLPIPKEVKEVQEAIQQVPEPESGVSWTTGIGLVALVVILGAAFAKYRCKCKK